jgi:predicted nuclease with TOPRIM domain
MNEIQLYWPQLVTLAGFVWWAMRQARDYERLLSRVEWLETTATELAKVKVEQTQLSNNHDRLKDSVDRLTIAMERLESKLDALTQDVHGIKVTLATKPVG